MSEYPAWQAFQSLVRESFYNRVTAGAVACAAKSALAEQVDRAERAEATIEQQRGQFTIAFRLHLQSADDDLRELLEDEAERSTP